MTYEELRRAIEAHLRGLGLDPEKFMVPECPPAPRPSEYDTEFTRFMDRVLSRG